jgi:hypothetical protein
LAAIHLAQGLNGWNPARSFLRGNGLARIYYGNSQRRFFAAAYS